MDYLEVVRQSSIIIYSMRIIMAHSLVSFVSSKSPSSKSVGRNVLGHSMGLKGS